MIQKKGNLTEGALWNKLVVFIVPLLLTGLVQRLFNAADVVLARWLGTGGNTAVAAVGSTTALTNLMISFFIGCAGGSAVTLSHAVGSEKKDAIKKTLHTAMLLSLVLGGVLTAAGLLGSEGMLRLMDTPQELIGLSAAYLKAYFLGMIPYMVYNFGAAVLRAVGETQKPFYFLLISGSVKLLLTVLFVSVWDFGVMGLALATTCSQAVSAALIVATLMRRKDDCRLFLKDLRFHPISLKRILSLGIPAGIQSATFSLSGVVIQSSINSLSHLEGFIAGNAAAISIESFADAVTNALFQTGISFTGQNYGARRFDRIRKTYRYLIFLTAGIIGVFSLSVCLFPKAFLALFLEGEVGAIRWGTVRLTFFFAPLLLQGLMDVTGGCIRGLGRSFSPMLISLLGICGLRILWMLTVFRIPSFHTPACLYLAYPISWLVTYLADLALYRYSYKKAIKKEL